MGDNSVPAIELNEKSPSVYRIWQKVRQEGGSEGEMLDRYHALLEEYGHRNEMGMRWQ